tara:strand:+ start:3026 stop:3157 length:132 start_codon:yes stop_codon:yes gene_type:complete
MSGKKNKKEEKLLTGEELYLALQKQWYNSRSLRRDFGKGTKEK